MKKITAGRDGTYRFTYDIRMVTSAQGSCDFRLQLNYSYFGADYITGTTMSASGASDSGWYSVPASGVIDVAMVAGQEIFLIAYGMSTVTAYRQKMKFRHQ
jgi:hypothetical protein